VASYFHDDGPAPEEWQHLNVVVGDVGHAGHEDDWRAAILTARVEIVDADVTVVGEP
jgi:hypothetical protein